jgi:hypothetical protein
VLLLDDDDEVPPSDDEQALATQLGPAGLKAIDRTLLSQAAPQRLKVARILYDAFQAGHFSPHDDAAAKLHARRVLSLVESGYLEAQGNLRRPRFSEIRLPKELNAV